MACNTWRSAGRVAVNPEPGSGLISEMAAAQTESDMAKEAGVPDRTIRQAKAVVAHAAPEVLAAVKSGEVSVKAAAEVAKLPADEQAEALHAPKPKKNKPLPTPDLDPLPDVALQPTDPNARDPSENESLRQSARDVCR